MLKYTITGDNILIPDSARAYIEKRFKGFGRFIHDDAKEELLITVSKTTEFHRDDSTRVEVKFRIHSKDFFAVGEAVDMLAAADMAKEELMREVTHSKAKRITLFHRGARKMKSMMKGGSRKEKGE